MIRRNLVWALILLLPLAARAEPRQGENAALPTGETARVVRVFDDGRVLLYHQTSFFGGEHVTVQASELGELEGCGHGLCVGQETVTKHEMGMLDRSWVTAIYPNGDVRLHSDSRRTDVVPAENVIRDRGCAAEVCVGERVIAIYLSAVLEAVVVGVAADRIQIQGGTYFVSRWDVAKPDGCSGGYCVGDQVVAAAVFGRQPRVAASAAKIAAIFPDGRLALASMDGSALEVAAPSQVEPMGRREEER